MQPHARTWAHGRGHASPSATAIRMLAALEVELPSCRLLPASCPPLACLRKSRDSHDIVLICVGCYAKLEPAYERHRASHFEARRPHARLRARAPMRYPRDRYRATRLSSHPDPLITSLIIATSNHSRLHSHSGPVAGIHGHRCPWVGWGRVTQGRLGWGGVTHGGLSSSLHGLTLISSPFTTGLRHRSTALTLRSPTGARVAHTWCSSRSEQARSAAACPEATGAAQPARFRPRHTS